VRFDVALFELRLCKSRSAASVAIQDGEALLNGAVVKPSHGIKPGDRITLVAHSSRRTLEVMELPRAGLSREAAKALVREVGAE
jgi:ribosomal 50S subunit-recycling heat shock protein